MIGQEKMVLIEVWKTDVETASFMWESRSEMEVSFSLFEDDKRFNSVYSLSSSPQSSPISGLVVKPLSV